MRTRQLHTTSEFCASLSNNLDNARRHLGLFSFGAVSDPTTNRTIHDEALLRPIDGLLLFPSIVLEMRLGLWGIQRQVGSTLGTLGIINYTY